MATLKSVRDNVKALLKSVKATRDSDIQLVRRYWDKYGDVAPETITRARRAIQANQPELRGNTYQDRQIYAGSWA